MPAPKDKRLGRPARSGMMPAVGMQRGHDSFRREEASSSSARLAKKRRGGCVRVVGGDARNEVSPSLLIADLLLRGRPVFQEDRTDHGPKDNGPNY